jgi:hypothetical protein
VRCAKLGLDHKLKGALIGPSAYFKKSPPRQFPDEIAREMTEAFIKNPESDSRHAAALANGAPARPPARAGAGAPVRPKASTNGGPGATATRRAAKGGAKRGRRAVARSR